MKYVLKLPAVLLAMTMCATISACVTTPEPPPVVSDFCLNDRKLSTAGEPAAGAEDLTPGNQYDTDRTRYAIYEHDAVHDRLCPADAPQG